LLFLCCSSLFAQDGIGPAVYQRETAQPSLRVAREVIEQLPTAARHVLEPMALAAITTGKTRERLPRAGSVRELPSPIRVELSDEDLTRSVGRALSGGFVSLGPDDRFLWTMSVADSGAGALKLRLESDRTQPAVYAAVFNRDGECHGPYPLEASQPLWTNAVAGAEIFLQVSIARGSGASFDVTSVGHLDAGLFAPSSTRMDATSCFIDATCVQSSEFPRLAEASKAIALLLLPTTGGFYVCTGGLLADAAHDFIPYFLTADHCLEDGFDVANVEAYWNERSTICNGAVPPLSALERTHGAKVIRRSAASDFALLQLDAPPPSGSVFLGWSPSAVGPGTKLYRLSHPLLNNQLSVQMFSRTAVDGGPDFCDELPRSDFIYSTLDSGAVSGGSSGAPVMLDTLQVVGQLYGSCAEVEDDCSHANYTVDGSFASTYPKVAAWLSGAVCVSPGFASLPADLSIRRGEIVTLTGGATGTAPFIYEWYVVAGGHATFAASGPTFMTGPQVTTAYQLIIRNACGEARSALVTVTVSGSARRRAARH
jgi:hypothetical protein